MAAGLLAPAVHTAHEAGWLNALQHQALDLAWLVQPGSVRSALLTGMLGIQPQPTVGELGIYVLYAIPMTMYVLSPGRAPARVEKPRTMAEVGSASSALLVIGALTLATLALAAAPVFAAKQPAVKVTLTSKGCPKRVKAKADRITFAVSNDNATAVSEFEVLRDVRAERGHLIELLRCRQESTYTCDSHGTRSVMPASQPSVATVSYQVGWMYSCIGFVIAKWTSTAPGVPCRRRVGLLARSTTFPERRAGANSPAVSDWLP